jgi:death-on-curing protein
MEEPTAYVTESFLSSALAMPSTSFEGKYLHKDPYDQAAAYAFHICQNHSFVDGDKRTALAAALVFLLLNEIELDDPNEALYQLMMNVSGKGTGKGDNANEFRRLHHRTRRAGWQIPSGVDSDG